MSPSAPMSSFVRRLGGSRVVLPSIDALLSARGDEQREQHSGHQHLFHNHGARHDHYQQAQLPVENFAPQRHPINYVQQHQEQRQELQPQIQHDQDGDFHSHAHPEPDFAALPLPSRQSLRLLSSTHTEVSREVTSHMSASSAAAVYAGPQAVSHIPRPSTAAADFAFDAKKVHAPDGRFEFVGASIADGRRKQLARPGTAVSLCCTPWCCVHRPILHCCALQKGITHGDSTSQHPSRPGRRQHAAVAHLFDAKQAVSGIQCPSFMFATDDAFYLFQCA